MEFGDTGDLNQNRVSKEFIREFEKWKSNTQRPEHKAMRKMFEKLSQTLEEHDQLIDQVAWLRDENKRLQDKLSRPWWKFWKGSV